MIHLLCFKFFMLLLYVLISYFMNILHKGLLLFYSILNYSITCLHLVYSSDKWTNAICSILTCWSSSVILLKQLEMEIKQVCFQLLVLMLFLWNSANEQACLYISKTQQKKQSVIDMITSRLFSPKYFINVYVSIQKEESSMFVFWEEYKKNNN